MYDDGKTVFITGASSGIGKATAKIFARRGWNVVAGMRQPRAEKELVEDDRLKLMPIDVQDTVSIRGAVAEAVALFGSIDVWVNNAGYGAFGPLEAGSQAQIQRQFDVNVFGLIECVHAIAPHFRSNRHGVLINVSSAGGLALL
ncbi:SDR family NAD(P)-dependent oxidoreductase [Burkholderia sp. L27(2015)]|uniref:SDR family NAD(P)-dependent oxidoreductase n=1 Tax=Burkholderia sp. L27(2015) TaxID=1641858 RepID=UPI00131DA559|nr:SDR family NAD(P)-dependent oxidoreductase [Burkholderia sp. L27(2015)]